MAINEERNCKFTFILEKTLKEEIVKIAKEERRSVSNIVAWCVDRYVKEYYKKQNQQNQNQ